MTADPRSDSNIPSPTETTRLIGGSPPTGTSSNPGSISGSGSLHSCPFSRRDFRSGILFSHDGHHRHSLLRYEEEAAVDAMKRFLVRAFTYSCFTILVVVLFLLAASVGGSMSSSSLSPPFSSSSLSFEYYRMWYSAAKQVRGEAVLTAADADVGVRLIEADAEPLSAELHDHTLPTPLGVRHHETGLFLNSLDNALFEEMKVARFSALPEDVDNGAGLASKKSSRAQFEVDRTSIRFGDPITLSWAGRHNVGEVGAEDVVALYCPSTEVDPRRFRDAATVRQILAADEDFAHGGGDDASAGRWRVHRFPTIREGSCEFRLWRRTGGQAASALATSAASLAEGSRRRRRRLLAPPAAPTSSDLDEEAAPPSMAVAVPSFELAAATGPFVLRDAMATPTAIHLSLTGNPSEMVVQFTTGIAGTPIVRYRLRDGGENTPRMRKTGVSSTYSASDMCQAPANLTEPGKFISPGQLHAVKLTGLELDEHYAYRVGVRGLSDDDDDDNDSVLWSDEHVFHAAPPAGRAASLPFSFIAYGDQGCPGSGWLSGADQTARLTEREASGSNHIRMVHHFGDLSYAQGAAHIWDDWFDMISPFTPRVPLMVGVGNHEYDHTAGGQGGRDPSGVDEEHGYMPEWGNFGTDSGGECGVPTHMRFAVPENGNGVFWYSFDFGPVHTVMISTEHDLSPGSVQYGWLEEDLRSVDRTETPWLIVESHRPMYQPEDKPQNTAVGEHMQDEYEHLLQDYDVDLFLAGHYHSYHRSCGGLYRSECGAGGPTHITVGSAGAQLDTNDLFENNWTDFYSSEWGYGRATVTNTTALHWEFVADAHGSVRDELWLTKEA